MTQLRLSLIFLSILFVWAMKAQAASSRAAVAESGEIILVARSSKFDVRVSIRTRPVEKRAETLIEPGGYVERSHVERIDIMVNGKQLWVGRSVYCDLFDLHNAEILMGPKTVVLAVEGGDASESHWAKIEFDTKQVKRRNFGSGMTPGESAEVTTYHPSVMKDE